MDKSGKPFMLKAPSLDFLQRQKSVFDQLTAVKPNLQHGEDREAMDVDGPSKPKTPRSFTKQFRGKESIFKRPEDPITKNYMRKIPDYKKNPHKWKMYSLEDVKDEHMSDRSNTTAALSFLNELKTRKIEEESDDIGDRRIVFKKVNNKTKEDGNDDEDEVKPTFRSSKRVMPEYVVGQKQAKEKKNRDVKKNGGQSQLKLDHLLDEDE